MAKTTAQFIADAIRVHGQKYDYSSTVYVKSRAKVKIRCPKHGMFEIEANSHLQGKGCKLCAVGKVAALRSSTTQEFVAKARAVHGDKYDYAGVSYLNNHTKVSIICPVHGEFQQTPAMHLSGRKCSLCAIEAKKLPVLSVSEFIKKAASVHGDRFNYDKVAIKSNADAVVISCSVHGDFRQTIKSHLKGGCCPKCSAAKNISRRDSFEDFEAKALAIHGNRYSYVASSYSKSKVDMTIVCKQHGEFFQKPNLHLQGSGCPKCALADTKARAAKTKIKMSQSFLDLARKTHGDKFDYSLVEYNGADSYIKIICPSHGMFEQRAINHLRGVGCRLCGYAVTKGSLTFTQEEFLARCSEVHGDKFDYSSAKYEGYTEKLEIRCRDHGVFLQTPLSHLSGNGCKKCSCSGVSKAEDDLAEFLSDFGKVHRNDRTLIAPLELDCVIQERKLAVEYCGNYFHSSKFKDKDYHLVKMDIAKAAGFSLVQVFEDEWIGKRPIVESILRNRLRGSVRKIPARATKIVELSVSAYRDFMNSNHIQGYAHAGFRYGLEWNGELVMAAAFSNSRKIFESLDQDWFELVRLCTVLNTTVTGGFSKLLRNFISKLDPSGIKTYCDNRLFNGAGYETVGFKKLYDTKPNLHYTKAQKRYSRFKFQKHKLPKVLDKYDPSLSVKENLEANGIYAIHDCGNSVFELRLN